MKQNQNYGRNELIAGIVGVITGLSFLLFTNFWQGVINVGSYLNTAHILPQTFRVVSYVYITVFSFLTIFSAHKLLSNRARRNYTKQPVTASTILLRVIVTGGVIYVAALVGFGVVIGGGPAGLGLLPGILAFWVFGPILPLAVLLLRVKKTGQPLRKMLFLFVALSVIAILISGAYAVVKQREHDKPIAKSSVVDLIKSCQLREVYRNSNNEVELLYKDKTNLPADKLKGDTKDYNQYIDEILEVRPKCIVAYRDDVTQEQSMQWYSPMQAKDALLSCSINRVVVTHEVVPWTSTGELFAGQNTGVLYKDAGYKGKTLEIQETIVSSDITPLRANIDKTCGKNSVLWIRDNNNLY